jgi:NAD-dependent dihydropyrimidine dehydrogenase PreA subunit
MSIQFIVEMIDAGCDCCSYITVGSFETIKEAKDYIGDDSNLELSVDASDQSIISMAEAIERVRELHKSGKAYLDDQPMCIHCRTVEFPCPTIKALDGEQ